MMCIQIESSIIQPWKIVVYYRQREGSKAEPLCSLLKRYSLQIEQYLSESLFSLLNRYSLQIKTSYLPESLCSLLTRYLLRIKVSYVPFDNFS